jgi:hypothetical protein
MLGIVGIGSAASAPLTRPQAATLARKGRGQDCEARPVTVYPYATSITERFPLFRSGGLILRSSHSGARWVRAPFAAIL